MSAGLSSALSDSLRSFALDLRSTLLALTTQLGVELDVLVGAKRSIARELVHLAA